jgi:excisionase family DNA binding protein
MLTLGQAARLTGTSKTTLTRAIRAGRLSATRRDDGGYEIDPAELARVFTVTPDTGSVTGDVVHRATPDRDPGATPVTPVIADPELMARLAAAEAELAGLKALLEEVRASRDREIERADRVERLLTDQRRPWWRRLAG